MAARFNWVVMAAGGVCIVVVAFWSTLRILDYVNGVQPGVRPADSSQSRSSFAPSSSVVLSSASALGDLPKLSTAGSYPAAWDGIVGIGGQPSAEAAIVPGERVLRLVATPDNTLHRLSIRIDGVPQNQTNTVTAWVKPGTLDRIALEVRDGKSQKNMTAIYDLGSQKVVLTAGDPIAPAVTANANGWMTASLGFPMPGGDPSLYVYVRLMNKAGAGEFKADGQSGLLFGGIQIGAPQ